MVSWAFHICALNIYMGYTVYHMGKKLEKYWELLDQRLSGILISKYGGLKNLRQSVRRASPRQCRWHRPYTDKAPDILLGHTANE